jgi:predicted NBD/HSP70 family sugar kinase
MRKGQVLAVDLGGTNVRLGMVSRDGRILRRKRTRIPAARGAFSCLRSGPVWVGVS